MIKITNGVNTIQVTSGAFENVYKKMGYQVVKQPKAAKADAKETAIEIKIAEDEAFAKEFEETPANNWNKKALKQYAEIKGIDLVGTKNFNEARTIVKEFIDGSQKEEVDV